ncbi:MAG TPA: bifunctional diaminohydroxyphosphoribosylaminopyrimidine deaminase/5-amino-6-(5-phosphoribosylamino)uracil reductase RibD [Acidimicrobiia bacterium]|nr:bifunctional diaminohydroxyphosphoribosylaminopyrimidine deaminase/5-amino-6-(5-phosphoribosylamino)uracil reductase RibD [Acidimicrobiia bacterium]
MTEATSGERSEHSTRLTPVTRHGAASEASTTTFMARALELARGVRRLTAPNPWVGCVIVKDGVVVGEGATRPPGGAHAEVIALEQAGERARGAEVFTTLEPCVHVGRTGPCTNALAAAGVARVVSALEDPDPHVAGRGFAALRASGIVVDVGDGARDAAAQLAPYIVHRREGRSFVVLKSATSLDGRVAAADGESRWITGAAARADAHALRADGQAVIVGSGTALADLPALSIREVTGPLGPPPLRVLLDARGRVPASGPLFDPSLAPTLVFTTERSSGAARAAWEAAGAAVELLGPGPGGSGVDLVDLLVRLGARGVLQALVEGGPTVHAALLATGPVDRIVAYVAPMLLGAGGRAGYGLDPGPALAAAPRYRLVRARPLGDDVCLEYEPP